MPPRAILLKYPPLLLALGLYLLLVAAELAAILVVNQGTFIFALDDPYIHLALAENIWQGHYGVNTQEYSAPSSSILWPLLIAPFAAMAVAPYLLLLINTVLGALALVVAARVIRLIGGEPVTARAELVMLLLFMLVANLVGLAYTGMEHSLQVLVAAVVVWGLIAKLQRGQTPAWLWPAIIVAPLVRYECLTISAVALVLLFYKREYGKSMAAGLAIVALLGGFSLFLLQLGLSYLPDSVLAKSSVASSGMEKLLWNLLQNFKLPNTPKAFAMLVLTLFLLSRAWQTALGSNLRVFALLAGLALGLHLLVGRVGWLYRYEIYVWVMAVAALAWLYLAGQGAVDSGQRQRVTRRILVLCVGVSVLEGINVLVATPIAASNIYRQQYQVHRFLEGYYHKPVAVNDLGWTTYRNDQYVLDLWGLGSGEARMLRKTSSNGDWMEMLADRSGIGMIIIYKSWFADIPENWVAVATLDVSGIRITVGWPATIFARSAASAAEIRQALGEFSNTLPEGSVLTMLPPP